MQSAERNANDPINSVRKAPCAFHLAAGGKTNFIPGKKNTTRFKWFKYLFLPQIFFYLYIESPFYSGAIDAGEVDAAD